MTTIEDLNRSAREARLNGKPTPCLGRDEWTSNNPEDRKVAARGCTECPIFDTCRAYATDAVERFNTWGGYDYGRPGPTPVAVSGELIRRVGDMRRQGDSIPVIARTLGLDQGWVSRHLRRALIEKPEETLPHAQRAVELHKLGNTYDGIGQALGITGRQARYAIDRARKAGEL